MNALAGAQDDPPIVRIGALVPCACSERQDTRVVLIGDYYLRAIALTILSFAAGSVIIGFSYGFLIGFASTSSSQEATEKVALVGGV